MRKILLIAVLFFSGNSFAQKGYVGMNIGADVSSDLGTGVALQGNALINAIGDVYIGGGAGLTFFPELNKPVIPIFGQLAVIPKSKKLSPIFFFQPGIGTYNNKDLDVSRNGFFFSAGAGVKLPSSSKGAPYLSVGYSSYSFKGGRFVTNRGQVNLNDEKYGCFSFKAGFMIW